MAESNVEAEGEKEKEEERSMSRKEKRKERKRMKRKKVRKEVAEKEREEEEAKLDDPEEQKRLQEMEEEENQRIERERKEFEERERKFLEEIERKMKLLEEEEEEKERQKVLEDEQDAKKFQVEKENEFNDDDDWEYVEEGPAEIIWQGNEIIVRKKKIPKKKSADQQSRNEDDRPTSNPLPPQSEAFAEYQKAPMPSAERMLENVAQQIPNFGTEQDKAHCPFHLKTGACRFGQRCSRVHFYPDKANTLLMKNMYNGPGLAWEQDEGLEHTDEEVERSYEEFYEDVHTEFLKYGEIVNFKVCKNSSFHLRGNVYVQYKSLDSAVLAYCSINGRYFAGKQVNCEFVNVTRWKVAICGEYMKSRLQMCSRGTACNFIHCFRNPGGDYEWADWDKPPPRYWIEKMTALFGYSDESACDKQMEQDKFKQPRMSSKRIPAYTDRHHSSRSRSRDIYYSLHYSGKSDNEDDDEERTHRHWRSDDDRKQIHIHDEKSYRKDYHLSNRKSHDMISDGGWSDGDSEADRERNKRHGHGHVTKRSKHHSEVTKHSTHWSSGKSKDSNHKAASDEWSDGDSGADRERNNCHGHVAKRSKHQSEVTKHSTRWSSGKSKDSNHQENSDEWSDGGRNGQKEHSSAEVSEHRMKGVSLDDNRNSTSKCSGADGYQSDREKHHSRMVRSSRHQSKVRSMDDLGDGKESNRDEDRDRHDHPRKKRSRPHSRSSELSDDYQDDRYRTRDTDLKDDWLDENKERHQRHKRRHSRRSEQEISDDEEISAKRLKEKSYSDETEIDKSHLKGKPVGRRSSRQSHSSRKSIETNCSVESLNLSENYEFNYVDSDTRCKDIEETNEQDRWKPESPDRLELY
ncbi:U2 snrnp auxiliary factor, small subunit, putative [Ricinus communis]|uniref:U2 snrnp auxiliary factor, small subunit, putative n=1 Tax=Ricinus communis TaxID=3988 RepID=B9SPC8_RICCO|nr:U2 snrnp auxiliary factor, small subunit, putative [Ricinus communis]|eukprot:XP_002527847.1 zinc finger CCCH domain-containing protein 5 isoform X2 [Ricinus communis]